jgi:NADH-quinone oxidoreductase subunit C
MPDDALIGLLQHELPGVAVEAAPSIDLQTTLYISRDDLPAVARALREAPDLDFALLAELTAVDFWPKEPRYELIYTFVSIAHRRRLRVKARLTGSDAHVATVTSIWPAANWLEREVWDLFGHPLRKDYPVQIRKTPTSAEPLQVTAEEFRANIERDRLVRRD